MVKANGDRYWYATNDLYSVYALTDGDGTVVERYTYDPYGAVTIWDGDALNQRAESAYGNPWTFTGRRLDQETGLMYYRNRMYSVDLGRFCGRDPIGYRGGIDLYEGYFVPLGTDPYGLFSGTFSATDTIKRVATKWITCACGKIKVDLSIDASLDSTNAKGQVPEKGLGLDVYFLWMPTSDGTDGKKQCCCNEAGWQQRVWSSSGWKLDNGQTWYEPPKEWLLNTVDNSMTDYPHLGHGSGPMASPTQVNGMGDDFYTTLVCTKGPMTGHKYVIIRWGYKIAVSAILTPPQRTFNYGSLSPSYHRHIAGYTATVTAYIQADCN